MKATRSILWLASLACWLLALGMEPQDKQVGQIEQVSGAAYWRENSTSEPTKLNAHRDFHRPLYPGENVRCLPGCVLVLKLYDREITVTPCKSASPCDWYPIPLTAPTRTIVPKPEVSLPGGRVATAYPGHKSAPQIFVRNARPVMGAPAGAAVVRSADNGVNEIVIRRGGDEMTIRHDPYGGRTIFAKNGDRIIVSSGHAGYVQRPYLTTEGGTYFQRTYVVGDQTSAAIYRKYYYRGAVYYSYVPTHGYDPAFLAWAYTVWPAPVDYSPEAWGWSGAPWYGRYSSYFTPYPAYPSASQWLADYLIASNLHAAYAAQTDSHADAAAPVTSSPSGAGQTPLTPELKQMIADEVKQQLASERASDSAASARNSTEVPGALNPVERVFVVSSTLGVTSNHGDECSLTPGDVVMRLTDAPDENQNVRASVQASKGGDCAAGQQVTVAVQDLQEMHNHFLQQLDAGLSFLASNAGKRGLPPAPDTRTTTDRFRPRPRTPAPPGKSRGWRRPRS